MSLVISKVAHSFLQMRSQVTEGGRINTQADVIFEQMDANGDGSITRDEFLAAIKANPELKTKVFLI
jgi:Ca2+-binding EF-hand superfamily protein